MLSRLISRIDLKLSVLITFNLTKHYGIRHNQNIIVWGSVNLYVRAKIYAIKSFMLFCFLNENYTFQDCLVQQGMYTQYTEMALKNVADVVNNLSYDINLGMNCIASLTPQIDTAGNSKEL